MIDVEKARKLAKMIARTFAGMAAFSRQGNRTDVFTTVLDLVGIKPGAVFGDCKVLVTGRNDALPGVIR